MWCKERMEISRTDHEEEYSRKGPSYIEQNEGRLIVLFTFWIYKTR